MVQDQGRDTYYALRIAEGEEFPTFGPWMSIDLSARGSPIYYYIIAVGCLFANTPYATVIEANVLWLAAIIVAYLALSRVFDKRTALFTAVLLLVCPELLHMTDTVWNPYLLATFSLLAFSFSILFAHSGRVRWWYAFAVMGAVCTHMHPMASLVALAFLPVVGRRPAPIKHKLVSSAIGLALSVPMLVGVLTGPVPRLTWIAFALSVAIGPLIAVGHSLSHSVLPLVDVWYSRSFRIVWGLILALSIYLIAVFGVNTSRPTLWLLAFFALLNVVGKRRTDEVSKDLARYFELPVVVICILPCLLLLAADLVLRAQPRPHYITYVFPVIAVFVGLRLHHFAFRAERGGMGSALLRGAVLLATVILLGLGHVWGHFVLTGYPNLFTFEGSKTVTVALLERFGDNPGLFKDHVLAYPKDSGQEDEECAMHVYYHLLRGRYPRRSETAPTQYILIVNAWEAPRQKYRNCFLSTPHLSLFEFGSVRELAKLVWGLGFRTPLRLDEFWLVPFYVDGYDPRAWLRIALAND